MLIRAEEAVFFFLVRYLVSSIEAVNYCRIVSYSFLEKNVIQGSVLLFLTVFSINALSAESNSLTPYSQA
jgi:hypothetical protein